MRDRLDGIHTRDGRVVYDRKKHEFTIRDVQRIVEKVSLPQERERIDDDQRFFQVLWEIVFKILDWAASNPEIAAGAVLLGVVANLIDSAIDYCGSGDRRKDYSFGGAGVTRIFEG